MEYDLSSHNYIVDGSCLTDVCSKCQSLAQGSSVIWQTIEEAGQQEEISFDHYGSVCELQDSAEDCCLCSLMWHALLECLEYPQGRALPQNEGIVLYFWKDKNLDGLKQFHMRIRCGGKSSDFYGDLICDPTSTTFQSFPSRTRASRNDTNTGSEASFFRMKAWLDICTSSHDSCQKLRVFNPPLPTRVLDVGTNDSTICRLVSGAGKRADYATLSHCWGAHQPLKTTKATITARKISIQDSALPKTFRDAVTTCRKLDIRYLWIDSLCIIQDNKEDWETEAPTMGEVYGNSLFTIAAAAAKDSTEGCFQIRNGSSMWPCFVSIFGLPCLVSRSPPFLEMFDDAETTILDFRAWTMQEQILASRTLSFTAIDLKWTCAELIACERWPLRQIESHDTYHFSAYSNRSHHGHLHLIISKIDGALSGPSKRNLYRRWNGLVQDYTARTLTFGDDKLLAIAGVAQRFRTAISDEYCAGLWKNDIHNGLLWRTTERMSGYPATVLASRPPKRRAPSWSWASIDGYIDYPPRPQHEEGKYIFIQLPRKLEIKDPTSLIAHQFGQTSNAPLTMQAMLVPVTFRAKSLYYGHNDTQSTKQFAVFWRDVSKMTDSPNCLYCMPLCIGRGKPGVGEVYAIIAQNLGKDSEQTDGEALWSNDSVWCLVLEGLPGLQDTFVRVGICVVHKMSLGELGRHWGNFQDFTIL